MARASTPSHVSSGRRVAIAGQPGANGRCGPPAPLGSLLLMDGSQPPDDSQDSADHDVDHRATSAAFNLDELPEPEGPRFVLDMANLPEKFTPDQVQWLTISQIKQLEASDLTDDQRSSLKAAQSEMMKPLLDAVNSKLFPTGFVSTFSRPRADVIGEDLRKALENQSRILSAPVPSAHNYEGVVTSIAQHKAEQDRLENARWQRQHDLIEAVATSTAALAARSEQQHREAERQKGLTRLLAFAVILSTLHPLVQSHWTQVLQTLGFALPIFLVILGWTWLRGRGTS